MAKWIIIDPKTGEALVHEPENETLDYDNGQQAAATAAAFLIDFPDAEVPKLRDEELVAIREALDLLPERTTSNPRKKKTSQIFPRLSFTSFAWSMAFASG